MVDDQAWGFRLAFLRAYVLVLVLRCMYMSICGYIYIYTCTKGSGVALDLHPNQRERKLAARYRISP